MGTRRPLICQMAHDPDALEPRCWLQKEGSDEFIAVPAGASVSDTIYSQTEAHLKQLGKAVSSTPIVLRAEVSGPGLPGCAVSQNSFIANAHPATAT